MPKDALAKLKEDLKSFNSVTHLRTSLCTYQSSGKVSNKEEASKTLEELTLQENDLKEWASKNLCPQFVAEMNTISEWCNEQLKEVKGSDISKAAADAYPGKVPAKDGLLSDEFLLRCCLALLGPSRLLHVQEFRTHAHHALYIVLVLVL